jgi:hypothetical protein
MKRVGEIYMADGGWSFAVYDPSEPRRQLWLSFETRQGAVSARVTMLELLQQALAVSVMA